MSSNVLEKIKNGMVVGTKDPLKALWLWRSLLLNNDIEETHNALTDFELLETFGLPIIFYFDNVPKYIKLGEKEYIQDVEHIDIEDCHLHDDTDFVNTMYFGIELEKAIQKMNDEQAEKFFEIDNAKDQIEYVANEFEVNELKELVKRMEDD